MAHPKGESGLRCLVLLYISRIILSGTRGVTEALSFGHGIALVLELGELSPPLLARCDFVRVLVEIIHVRAYYLDRSHAGATDPIGKEVSRQKADSDENGVDNFPLILGLQLRFVRSNERANVDRHIQ
jgi:hypothetical protein